MRTTIKISSKPYVLKTEIFKTLYNSIVRYDFVGFNSIVDKDNYHIRFHFCNKK